MRRCSQYNAQSRTGIGKLFLQRVDGKYFSFCGRMVSVATTELCLWSTKNPQAVGKQMGMFYIPIKIYLQK